MEKFHRSITVGRAQNFVSPHQFSDVNLKSRLYYDTVTAQDGDGAFVKLLVFSVPDLKRIPFSDATSLDKVYKPTSTGEAFGPTWVSRLPNDAHSASEMRAAEIPRIPHERRTRVRRRDIVS